jgi:hypothetical protein
MDDLINDPIFNKMGFSNEWISSGIVSISNFPSIKDNYLENKDEDPSTEHYRWKAFQSFLKTNQQISSDVFRVLHELGINDLDRSLGYAIIFDIIRRNDCPIEVIEASINDDYYPLSKHAMKYKNLRLNKEFK